MFVIFYRLSDSLYIIRNNDFTVKEFSKDKAVKFKSEHANGDDLVIVELSV